MEGVPLALLSWKINPFNYPFAVKQRWNMVVVFLQRKKWWKWGGVFFVYFLGFFSFFEDSALLLLVCVHKGKITSAKWGDLWCSGLFRVTLGLTVLVLQNEVTFFLLFHQIFLKGQNSGSWGGEFLFTFSIKHHFILLSVQNTFWC